MTKLIYSATIFFPINDGRRPRKYRNISNLSNFLKFAANSGGWYVNLYSQFEGKFEARKYL
jgi:hypothetical protein